MIFASMLDHVHWFMAGGVGNGVLHTLSRFTWV